MIPSAGEKCRVSAGLALNERDRDPAILSTARDSNIYHVQGDWDPEANVWVATSDDVPGLATEAATIDELTATLRT